MKMLGSIIPWLVIATVAMTQAAFEEPEIHSLKDESEEKQSKWLVSEVNKRDLEFNQYVPAFRLRGEPSCEELRAMWRLSKREARRATSTNFLPRNQPYTYGRMVAFAPKPHQRPFVYGEPRLYVHNTASFASPIKGSFNRLRNMLGINSGHPGSFQRVREMINAQRKPGETSKGKLKELEGIVLKDINQRNQKTPVTSIKSKASSFYQPLRRKLSLNYLTKKSSLEFFRDNLDNHSNDQTYSLWHILPSDNVQ